MCEFAGCPVCESTTPEIDICEKCGGTEKVWFNEDGEPCKEGDTMWTWDWCECKNTTI